MLMIHKHPVYDTDPHFSIDPNTRGITYTSSEQLILIQGDHNSQVYTFEIPRYIDGHDMMSCNLVQVHYINIDGSNSKNRSNGVYEVLDMQLDPEDENTCVFSWLISANATLFVGRLGFAIRFSCMEEDEPTYVWNTSVHDGVTIATGYNNSNVVVEQYADVLESWYYEFKDVTSTGVNVIEIARDNALDRINSSGGLVASETKPESEDVTVWFNTTDSTLRIRNAETGEFEPLTTIKGEKGDMPPIVQTTGDSEIDVMSQKAVTEQINSVTEQINSIKDVNDNQYIILSEIDNKVSDLRTQADLNEPIIDEWEMTIPDHETRISSLEGYTSIIEGDSNRISDLENTLHDYEDVESKVYDHETRISQNADDISNGLSNYSTQLSNLQSEVADHENRLSAVETKVESLESNTGGSSSGTSAQMFMYKGNGKTERTLTLPFKPALMIIQDTERTMEDLYVPYGQSTFYASGDNQTRTVFISYTEVSSSEVTVTITVPDPDDPTSDIYMYNEADRVYAIIAIGPFVQNSGYLT